MVTNYEAAISCRCGLTALRMICTNSCLKVVTACTWVAKGRDPGGSDMDRMYRGGGCPLCVVVGLYPYIAATCMVAAQV